MVQGDDGALFGTTSEIKVGTNYFLGSVFRVTTDGVLTTLAWFQSTNGMFPVGRLAQVGYGAFYGTAHDGGSRGRGTVFRVTTNGVLTALVSFAETNGAFPQAGLAQGSDGALYGTTSSGEGNLSGTVFRITTNGVLTTLKRLSYYEGAIPWGALALGSDGTLYGTTFRGGSRGGGNVFRVDLSSQMQTLTRGVNGWEVRFVGLPEASYRLLRATNLSGPWETLTNIIVGPDGIGLYLEDAPPPDNAFYRTAGR